MSEYGLLIDYNYCCGCRTCEIACQKAHEKYGVSERGLTVSVIGPFDLGEGRWQLDNLPLHTVYCNHCADRIENGKMPSCVHHCQSGCISFGRVEELILKMDNRKMVLYRI